MKNREALERFRVPVPPFMQIETYEESDEYGVYITGCYRMGEFVIIVSHEKCGWHLSVSKKNCLPTYDELKDIRYKYLPDRINACEIFPPRKKFVNVHPYCRHLFEMPEDEFDRSELI